MAKFLQKLNVLYVGALFFSLVVIIGCVILQVVSRYVFNRPFIWTEEISLFAFCWFTFMGSAACSYEKSHLEVDYFYNRAKSRIKLLMDIGIQVLVVVLSGIMIYVSIHTMKEQIGIRSIAARLPIPFYSLALVIGFIGMTLFSAFHLAQTVKRLKGGGS